MRLPLDTLQTIFALLKKTCVVKMVVPYSLDFKARVFFPPFTMAKKKPHLRVPSKNKVAAVSAGPCIAPWLCADSLADPLAAL